MTFDELIAKIRQELLDAHYVEPTAEEISAKLSAHGITPDHFNRAALERYAWAALADGRTKNAIFAAHRAEHLIRQLQKMAYDAETRSTGIREQAIAAHCISSGTLDRLNLDKASFDGLWAMLGYFLPISE